jgi:hypothetical protein
MADAKISALVAATTPLAGTEVVPVVQSSSTKNVSIANLTAGRAVAMRDANLTGGAAVINIGATADNTYHYVRTIDNDGQAVYFGNDNAAGSFFGAGAYGRVLYSEGAKPVKVFVNGAYRAEYDTSGNYKLDTGNLVIGTSGKGIDFSATSGTGTSELLADYEEGTWTPTLTTNGTNFTSVTYNSLVGGKYTKVGRVVQVNGFMFTDAVTVGAASGTVCIGGLPFTVNTATGGKADANSAMSVSRAGSWLINSPSGIQAAGATTLELYYRTTANGGTSVLAVTNVGTGGSSNLLYFAGTYIAA